jgi:hypothetical protein
MLELANWPEGPGFSTRQKLSLSMWPYLLAARPEVIAWRQALIITLIVIAEPET